MKPSSGSYHAHQRSFEPPYMTTRAHRSASFTEPRCFRQMYKIERVFVDTRKRKRRTSLEGAVRSALETYFIKCPKPNTQEITHISDDLGLERDVRTNSESSRFSDFSECVRLTLVSAGGSSLVLQPQAERKAPGAAAGRGV